MMSSNPLDYADHSTANEDDVYGALAAADNAGDEDTAQALAVLLFVAQVREALAYRTAWGDRSTTPDYVTL